MKLAALLSFTSLSLVSGATRTFTPPKDAFNNPVFMTAAKFNGGTTSELVVCPSGDCTSGQTIKVSVDSLKITDESGSELETFTISSAEWSEIIKETDGGLDVSTTTYTATLQDSETVTFTAKIFHAPGTTKITAIRSASVRAGAVKFSVRFPTWPSSDAPVSGQKLKLVLKLEGKTSTGTSPELSIGYSEDVLDTRVVSLGEGMFMDVPSKARFDEGDSDTDISQVVAGSAKTLELSFPAFIEGWYDSVIRSTDPSAAKPAPVVFKAPNDADGEPIVLTAANFVKGQAGKLVF
ncbi:hypothetical protein Poli38472_005710 [Pythium oligandrum]|uniref:Uncharacterized protein n=1 Tax=Pythium oligandrum TaxID=41045 RepID=A0A8K1CR25_PYTOL|nr:hypothetical protein Poli38472_005710 [Pythium oligandrum]|eukprot:TMW68242.1 hypothetical protein Poli38472_005710 [Pythium oligandrum]